MTEEYETDQANDDCVPDQSFSKVQKKSKRDNDARFISNEVFNTVERNNHRNGAASNGNNLEVNQTRNTALSTLNPSLN